MGKARDRAYLKTEGVPPPKPKKPKPEPHKYENRGPDPLTIGGFWLLFLAVLFLLTEGCPR